MFNSVPVLFAIWMYNQYLCEATFKRPQPSLYKMIQMGYYPTKETEESHVRDSSVAVQAAKTFFASHVKLSVPPPASIDRTMSTASTLRFPSALSTDDRCSSSLIAL